jgi:Tol biopolymer transport system component
MHQSIKIYLLTIFIIILFSLIPTNPVIGESFSDKLLILSDRTGTFQAYSLDLQTSVLSSLTAEPLDVSSASCASSGEFIATTSDGHLGIKITNVDTLVSSLIFQDTRLYSDVEISPDNQQIAYVATSENGFEIFVANIDGTNNRQLSSTPHIRETFLSWSSNNSLLFSAQLADSSGIFSVDIQSGVTTQLTNNLSADLSPDWSSNGSQIVFASDLAGRGSIYKMSADGSNLIELTQTDAPNWSPQWSRDDSRIAFTSRRDGNSEIYIMDADGSNQVRVTDDPSTDLMECWLTMNVANGERPHGSSLQLIHMGN